MPNRRFRAFALILIGALVLAPRAALAQFDAATVLGIITDQSGAAVPGATVTLTTRPPASRRRP